MRAAKIFITDLADLRLLDKVSHAFHDRLRQFYINASGQNREN